VRPGNKSFRCARITLESSTKAWRPPDNLLGSLITRGSTRGTRTMAMPFSRPKASLPASLTTKCRDLFATCGNGCDGSRLIGTSSGRTSRRKKLSTQSRCAASRWPCDTTAIRSASSAGVSTSL
jgi:hypothetical protein